MIIIVSCFFISFLFAPLSCLIVWRRYGCIGDGLAHSCLLAGVLHYITGIPIIITTIVTASVFSALLYLLQEVKRDNNTLVNLVASSITGIAILLSDIYKQTDDLEKLLFGDISFVTYHHLIHLCILGVILFILIKRNLSKMILLSLNRDIASVQGLNVTKTEFIVLLIITLAIATTIKIVGGLLISVLLMMPAMIAQMLSNTPTKMILHSIIFALIMNITGTVFYLLYGIPASAAIVITGFILFIFINLFRKYNYKTFGKSQAPFL